MDNRAKLLDCALALFASRGYDAVGIQEVVEAAGVTKPTLYHYFGSKRGLLDALLGKYFAEVLSEERRTADYHGDLPLTLTKVTQSYFAFGCKYPNFYRLQLAMHFAPPESECNQAVSTYSLEQHRILEEMFRQAVTQHGNMRGRENAYAATLLGMINTYIGIFLNGHIQLEDELVYKAVHQFMHGIFS